MLRFSALFLSCLAAVPVAAQSLDGTVTYGPRPHYLVDRMAE